MNNDRAKRQSLPRLKVPSTVPGIVWPGIAGPAASRLMAMQFHLERSQWLAPDEILSRQMTQLGQLLAHAYATVPYYRERLEGAGLSPQGIRGPVDWRAIPLLTRFDVQMAGGALQSTAVPKEHGPFMRRLTSGSTGRPVCTTGTAVTALFWNACTLRDHVWHRREPGATLAAIRALPSDRAKPPDGVTLEDSGRSTRGILETGPSFMLNVHSTVEQQADWLVRRDPDYLLTYPSNLLALVEHSRKSGWHLPRLREARTFGELLEPRVRRACRDAWNVGVVDIYSSQEVGYIALQCPETENYHIQSENVLVEILDDNNLPCAPGQVGRVVVTALHNLATPLLRYDIGDYAEVGSACPCGRGLPAVRRIVGRQRNMVVLPNGQRRWPSVELSNTTDAAELPPIQQFQLIQRTTSLIEALFVAPRPLSTVEEERVRAWILAAVGHPFEVRYRYVDVIPRAANGKYEEFRCEVDSL